MTSFIKAAKILLALDPKQSFELVEVVETCYSLTLASQLISGYDIPEYKQNILLHWVAEEVKNNLSQL